MLFLDFWDGVFENLGMLVERLLNTLWILLCQVVYPFITIIFTVFTNITGSLTDGRYETDLNTIISRIIMILTIVMTFYIVFEFVKYTVTPDSINDKEKGAMPLFARIIIAILLLAFVPKIFTKASEFQQKVIETNVIGKIILGAEQSNNDIASLGKEFTGELFGAFIYVKCKPGEEKDEGKCKDAHDSKADMIKQMKADTIFPGDNETFLPGIRLTFSDTRIRFAGLLALVVGCFALYVIFLYCKDIALREIQLLFLQIISPIAIMSYIAPKKDGMFQKWMKQSITTYLDVFIRLAALSFMLLMINLLGTKLLYEGTDDNGIITYVFLIIGLMMFLKKVPKLLQELFPSSGAASIGMGFSGKDRKTGFFSGARQVAARTAGAVAGIGRTGRAIKDGTLLSDAAKNKKGKIGKLKKFGTYANTMGRSAYSGYQAGKDGKIGDAIRTGQERVQTYESIVANGGTVLGHDYRGGHYQNVQAGIKLEVEKLEKKVKENEAKSKLVTSIKTAQDSAEERSKKKIESHEQKIKVASSSDATKLINSIGADKMSAHGLTITANQTTSQIYSMFEAKANSAKAVATAMNQELVTAQTRKNAATQQSKIIEAALPNANESLSIANEALARAKTSGNATEIKRCEAEVQMREAEVQRLNEGLNTAKNQIAIEDNNIVDLKTKIAQNEAEEVELQTLRDKALKELERYAFTQTLKGAVPDGEKDPVLEANIATARQNLDNVVAQAKADSAIEAELRTLLTLTEKDPDTGEDVTVDYLEKIYDHKNQITEFDTYDKIQGLLSGYASGLGDKNSAINEEIRRKQAETETLMANANASGKK